MRQRYGSSLIHTYAGQVLIIINPMKNLAIYTDKVIDCWLDTPFLVEILCQHFQAITIYLYERLYTKHSLVKPGII